MKFPAHVLGQDTEHCGALIRVGRCSSAVHPIYLASGSGLALYRASLSRFMQNGCLLVMSAKAGVDNKPLVILVAEDDPNDVLLLKWAFARSQLHATLRFVSNGLEVISYLRGEPPFADRTSFPLPRLLLLDLHMPAAGGFDVLEWLADAPEARGLRVI